MYKKIESSFPELESDVLAQWKKEGTFLKSVEASKKLKTFYDGPPFPTGHPHHGTIFVSILKDAMARFFTMKGFTVPRKWGWDCHGMPIENAVEKELKLTSKSQIECDIGVEKFNSHCRTFVSSVNDSWEVYIDKIGRWVDFDKPYRTMDTDYMESVIWVFKELHAKNLIYKDYRVTPYCYHCETPLSISDTRESDSTRPKDDVTIVVKFKTSLDIDGLPTFILAWTTTPWTLPANLALAINPDLEYWAVKKDDEIYILSKNAVDTYFMDDEVVVVRKFSGTSLAGIKYVPLFNYHETSDNNAFTVLEGAFVSDSDGVGIVHIAPAYGEDDYWLCKNNGINIFNPVNEKGNFTNSVPDFFGQNVHKATPKIINFLESLGKVVHKGVVTHNYPHCWRCRTPLIYRAMDAWYFSVEKIKSKLLSANKEINWIPETVKDGRFGNWLEGARDWNISRNRYWGTPLPVWVCNECNKIDVFGSINEIYKKSHVQVSDLHKEILDKITYPCSCGGKMERVSEVLDCWFEAGSMPYGQYHYPFENKEIFEKNFPADFIIEYTGQVRCWFYYLHVLSVALFDQPAFKNCLVHGTLLAEDGSKISKSKKNYTDPMELISKYGADPIRAYLINSPASLMHDIRFNDNEVVEKLKSLLIPLKNSYTFFSMYSNAENFTYTSKQYIDSENIIDKWILNELYILENIIQEKFSSYTLSGIVDEFVSFVDKLNNWYIRRSRVRFWIVGFDADKDSAYNTLGYVLENVSKLLAPILPFFSEHIYKLLFNEKESIHLESWPCFDKADIDFDLCKAMSAAREITTIALSIRQKLQLKVRQPLSTMLFVLPSGVNENSLLSLADLIKEEVNVKNIRILHDASEIAVIKYKANPAYVGRTYGKQAKGIMENIVLGNIFIRENFLVIEKDENEWTVPLAEVTTLYEGKNDKNNVEGKNGFVVYLESELTPQLVDEGVSNEINRTIQDMRKKCGYEITDRIILEIKGDLQDIFMNRLMKDALAVHGNLSEFEADACKNLTIHGKIFSISMKKNIKSGSHDK